MSLKSDVSFESGLDFLCAHVDKLEHNLFILVAILFVEEFFEGPVLLFEEFDLNLSGLSLLSLFLLEGLNVEWTELGNLYMSLFWKAR